MSRLNEAVYTRYVHEITDRVFDAIGLAPELDDVRVVRNAIWILCAPHRSEKELKRSLAMLDEHLEKCRAASKAKGRQQ